LKFQGIAEELAGLPGKYAPPKGQIYLACNADGLAQASALWRVRIQRHPEILWKSGRRCALHGGWPL